MSAWRTAAARRWRSGSSGVSADVAVSTCSEEVCPITPGVRRIRWEFPDPKNLPLDKVRPIRDQINGRVEQLVRDLNQEGTAT